MLDLIGLVFTGLVLAALMIAVVETLRRRWDKEMRLSPPGEPLQPSAGRKVIARIGKGQAWRS